MSAEFNWDPVLHPGQHWVKLIKTQINGSQLTGVEPLKTWTSPGQYNTFCSWGAFCKWSLHVFANTDHFTDLSASMRISNNWVHLNLHGSFIANLGITCVMVNYKSNGSQFSRLFAIQTFLIPGPFVL